MRRYTVTFKGWSVSIQADTEGQARYKAWLEYTAKKPTTLGEFIDYAFMVKEAVD